MMGVCAGFWLTIAREVLPADMSLEDTALFYARAGAAAYDAAIATYKVSSGQLVRHSAISPHPGGRQERMPGSES